MNFEESRLRTFQNWPTNAPVDARRIAKAGFYYMGQNLEVQCFSCGGRISEWNYNDKVMTRHRILDSQCPFVRSPRHSGNIPISNGEVNSSRSSSEREESPFNRPTEGVSSDSSSSSLLMNQDKMHEEANRLKSFNGWPISFMVSPKRLAEAGFYYVQQGDKVRCAYCSVIIGRWEEGDVPLTEHRRHSPDCSFLASISAADIHKSSSSGITFRPEIGDCSDGTMKSLGVLVHKVAKHPKYSSKDSRLATFTSWPSNMSQTPDDLADAGFYYAGNDDQVRCFHCDGGLRKWDSNDDPWIEHARWFPDCGFVILVRGEEFIRDAIQHHPPIISEEVMNSELKNKMPQVREPLQTHQVSEQDLERLLSSPAATAALQIGLDLSRVKMAIRQKMEMSGSPFSSSNDLIEAALDIQLEEVPFHDSEETWATPLCSPVRHKPATVRPVPRRIQCHESSESESASESDSHLTHHKEMEPKSNSAPAEKTSSLESSSPQSVEPSKTVTLEEENRRLREARLCKICMDNEVCIVFLPCGHLVTCVNCAHSLAACPVCRRNIKATVRTFLS